MGRPIYIVTGFMRSGTSMMMQCLKEGGIKPVYDPKRELMNKRFGDSNYQPNAAGFYEASYTDMQDMRFPLMHEGKCIKILRPGIGVMRPHPGGYYVVVMRRNKEEIRQSYEAFFGYELKDPYFSQYDEFIEWIIAHLKNRRDILKYIILDYRDVVFSPKETFLELESMGWPINPGKAALAVNPTAYRFRIERLTIGITP